MALFKNLRGSRADLDAVELHDGYAYFCMDDGTFHIDYIDADGELKRRPINAEEANTLAGYNIVEELANDNTVIPTAGAVLAAIPTKTSELENDSGFKTTDNNTTYALSKSGTTITLTGSDGSTTSVTDADTNTTYDAAGSSLGLVKSGGDVTIADGVITVNDDSHAHTIENVDGLQTALDSKSDDGHTHSYAGSSSVGGAATSANKLNTNAGSATQPVYFADGIPKATTYTLGKSVPSDAVFTDTNTHYTSKNVVGTTSATSNTTTALSNGAVYLNSVENGAVTSSHKISGSGATTVTTDTSGNIVISSTDNNTTYSTATTSAAGLMSASDKSKLDGIASGANAYCHPTTSGNMHIPSGGSSGQILRWSADGTAAWGADNNTTYSAATTSAAGLMSAADKTKLNGIATGANAYTLPTASSSTLGGVKTTSTVTSTSGLTACPIISGVPYYKDTNTTYNLGSFGITATAAELNYCDGVTSNIQTQLNGKAASSHTHDYAASSHGNHVPATETADNAKFLRNDNTWQTVTPANIGAAAAIHDHSYAPATHSHSASNITSGALGVARGGTGKSSWITNRLIYPSATTVMAQLAFPTTAGSVLTQGTSGAPYWTAPSDLMANLGGAKIATGSYTGTGTYGSLNPCSLTFDFVPRVVMVATTDGGWFGGVTVSNNTNNKTPAIALNGQAYGFLAYDTTECILTWSGAVLSWYNTKSEGAQLNRLNTVYYYVIIG